MTRKKPRLMTATEKRKAWTWMVRNADRLRETRPSDKDFAKLIKKELGIALTPANANTLRTRDLVEDDHGDPITWKPKTSSALMQIVQTRKEMTQALRGLHTAVEYILDDCDHLTDHRRAQIQAVLEEVDRTIQVVETTKNDYLHSVD